MPRAIGLMIVVVAAACGGQEEASPTSADAPAAPVAKGPVVEGRPVSDWKYDIVTGKGDEKAWIAQRLKATEVLARNVTTEPAALRALSECLSRSGGTDIESVARKTLLSLGESAIEPVASMLGEERRGTFAADVLWALGPAGIRRLVDALGDTDPVRSDAALRAVRRAGRDASPYLLEAMRTGRPATSRAAGERLAEEDDGATLIKALADRSSHDLAFEMLASMRLMARPYLEAAKKDPTIRADAERLLARLPAETK